MVNRTTQNGLGRPQVVLGSTRCHWPAIEMTSATESIEKPTDWQIHNSRNTAIVHLGGQMNELATEMDGHSGSIGPATPGEIWIIPAGRKYVSHARGTTIQYAVFSIDPITSAAGIGTERQQVELMPLAGQRDDYLFAATKRLLEFTSEQADTSQIEAETLSHLIMRHIHSAYCPNPGASNCDEDFLPSLSFSKAKLLKDFIFDSVSERVDLATLAQLADMTVHHLLIAFRMSFGTTPAQYILTQRLRRAKWLLLHTRLEITEIAYSTGFSSHSHLTSAFSRRFGYPPNKFRLDFSGCL